MGKYFVVVLSAIVLAACSGKNGTVTDNNGVGVTDFEIGIVEKSLAADYLCEGDATFGDSVKLYTRTHVTLQWPEKLGNADVKPLQDTLLARCFGNERPTSVDEAMSRYVADPVTMDDGSRLVRVDSVPDVDIDVRILERSIDVNVLSVNSRYAAFEIYGYIEFGMSADSFVNHMERLYSGLYLFAIKNSYLAISDKGLFEGQDINKYKVITGGNYYIPEIILKTIINNIDFVANTNNQGKYFIKDVYLENKRYWGVFIPIYDISNNELGYITELMPNEYLYQIKNRLS